MRFLDFVLEENVFQEMIYEKSIIIKIFSENPFL